MITAVVCEQGFPGYIPGHPGICGILVKGSLPPKQPERRNVADILPTSPVPGPPPAGIRM